MRRPGRLAAHPAEFVPENVIAVRVVAQRLTSRLGVGPRLHDELAALPGRYDGKGRLCGCRARRSERDLPVTLPPGQPMSSSAAY
ncbi:MAG TPA: hypothetical protein VFO01_00710 [Trebonia sp.]|nr:hypothetical protein [Trebonia sp.]